ncbi:MAG TPA: heat-inducible transcription repressor HrcA [Clostridiales bacterium]|nr:heat-inducible transcription repressor HrcA [Clostridiales bacterium]
MDLSQRKQRILKAIIDEYIGTAEPVGSRAISKKEGLGLSSATIRNEMADLEELGYLIQPHTSAGRIPTDSGYRFYVNSLMKRYQMSVEALEKLNMIMAERVNHLELIIKKASLIASTLTEYTTVVTSPKLNSSVIKKLELVNLGHGNVMALIITGTGMVKNQSVAISLSDEQAAELSKIISDRISGRTADELTFDVISDIEALAAKKLDIPSKVLINILNFVYEAIDSLDETEIYVNNAKSILSYPEFSDTKKAREMLEFLESKENLVKLIGSPKDGVDVKIGTENEFAELENSSLVTVNYKVGDKVVGRIGVIGPKRMNYAKVIASLDCISNQIDKILGEMYSTESEE